MEESKVLAAKDAAENLDGEKEGILRMNPARVAWIETSCGNDAVEVRMQASAPTIPCSRKATRSGFSILSIRFMVLLFKSSAGPGGEMAQSLSSIEAENG